jgi:hypothetical protein
MKQTRRQIGEQRPVIGALTNLDTEEPAYDLAPGIAVCLVLTTEGYVQMIGKTDDPAWLAGALTNTALALLGEPPEDFGAAAAGGDGS